MQIFLLIVLCGYAPVVLGWWLAALYYLRRARHGADALARVADWPARQPAPRVAFVVAVHNEAADIAACIRMLQAQTYPNFRILIANDRSTDATGEIVRGLAVEDPRIEIMDIRELPPGWMGKTHALATAVAQCRDDYLLFLDCDVKLTSDALTSVMTKVVAGNLAYFSFWPHLHLRSFWEQLLTPPTLMLLGAWALHGLDQKTAAGGARGGNGQFMLIRRDAYEAVGGHAGVAAELTEDTMLSHRVRAAGYPAWFGVGSAVYVSERAGNWRRTANALARVIVGSLERQRRVWMGMQMLLANAGPVWILPLGLICWSLGVSPALSAALVLVAGLHWVGMVLTARAALGVTLPERSALLGFPLGSLLLVGISVWCSYLLTGRGTVRWARRGIA